MTFRALAFLTAVAVLSPSARAAPLFQVTATNGVITQTDSDPNFIKLIEAVVSQQEKFIVFAGTPTQASITFMGVPNAVTVNQSPAGNQVTIRIDSIGFTKVFTGTSAQDVNNQITSFLKKDGAAIIAKFRKDVATKSTLAITDGSPSSTTASAARLIFLSQGFTPLQPAPDSEKPNPLPGRVNFAYSRNRIDTQIAGQTYHGDQSRLDGQLVSFALNERIRVELPVTAEYTDIEDTEIFGAGASLALPVSILDATPVRPWDWRLAPVFGMQTRGSFDAVAGGLSWHTGLVSSLDWRINHRFILSLANQVTYHQGFPLNIHGFTLDFDINQTILKNGARLGMFLTPSLIASVYVIDTHFMKAAAIDTFYTTGASLDFKITGHAGFGFAVESDMASHYRTLLGRLQVNWTW